MALPPFKWAFDSNAKRPLRPRCAGCQVPHGSTVWRLLQDPAVYWPGPNKPELAELYREKAEKIDLMRSDYCASCLQRGLGS